MSPPRPSLLALALLVMGCAGETRSGRASALPTPAPARAGTREPGAGPVPGSRAVQARAVPHDLAVRKALETAGALLGERRIVVEGVAYGESCGALVRAALASAGAPIAGGPDDVQAILAHVRGYAALRRTQPVPGDVVFLSERPGGPAEHVGLVQTVSEDGTALVLHRTERGVARLHLNAAKPWKVRSETGRALNDLLVVGGGKLPAGRLVVGFATVL
jgi:hypothetical protein